MVDLDDLIKHKNENTNLDFKTIQYRKEQHEALIKDIMSMANADTENDRYIIVGVKHNPSGHREILGIEKGDFIDSAIYQQIVGENVEPEIDFDYFPHKFEDKLLGIFRISRCFDKPYMMKKNFKSLKKGDSFIRKGSRQFRMRRRDLDKIIENKMKKSGFEGMVQISFSGYNSCQEIELPTIGDMKLPSQRAAEEIEKTIKEKKELAKIDTQDSESDDLFPIFDTKMLLLKNLSKLNNPLFPPPYEERSLEELEKNLEEIEEAYLEGDLYEFFELYSHKINICILNRGHTYIEDASIQLEIKKIDGLFIADRIFKMPSSISFPMYESMNYPIVDDIESSTSINQRIGDVKHHVPTDAFKVPIRVVLSNELAGKTIEIDCKIFGKNLRKPLNEILRIKAIPPINGQ